jgi:hypothetical protein
MSKQLLRPPVQFRPFGKPTSIEMVNAINGLVRWAESVSRVINHIVNDMPDDSTASDVAGIVSDFNDLLDVFRDLNVR